MTRLKDYFNAVSDLLAADSSVAGQVSHRLSIGTNREKVLLEFIERHAPRRLMPFLGGQVFAWDEPESKQIDILLSNDSTLSFDERRQTLVPVESVAAAITVKSVLKESTLTESLENLATIPPMNPHVIHVGGEGFERFQESFPRLFVFAFDGYTAERCAADIRDFYRSHATIPENRRPTFVVVNKKYFLARDRVPFSIPSGEIVHPGSYGLIPVSSETRGLPLGLLVDSLGGYVSWLNVIDFHLHLKIMKDHGVSLMQTKLPP